MGKAGTGKTLLAMAAGLKRTVMDREFRRLVVARPTVSMGKELGFLPGSLEEKLAPWMQPIHDALEMLSDLNMGHEHRRSGDLMRSGSIVVEALSYIRGRSIANQFMIIDEAQNLTPLEAKTIITRVGHGTKIVFTGDRLLAIRGAHECGSVVWRRNFFYFRGGRRAFFARNEGIAQTTRPVEFTLLSGGHRADIG